jgi:hypothetical protein
MLILPESTQQQMKVQHQLAKEGLTMHFNDELEKIMNANQAPDRYWILGKVKFPENLGGKVGRVFLQACMEKPPLVAEAFLYEVDNRRGVKTLLWVMHPGGKLALPTLGKTLSVAPKSKKKSKRVLTA